MRLKEEFRLSEYQDYGVLSQKRHIHLVRHKVSGKICVKKNLESMQKEVQEFRCSNPCEYFPRVYEMIEDDGEVILIEEYIEGMNLEEYMMGETLDEGSALKIAVQIAKGLKSLHDHQPMIIYRDLKPENIMITPEGNVKLIDFDISRKYQEGKLRDTELLGTVGYAAPEQFGYFQTDNRTDIFAFGLVFHYMLTGEFSTHTPAKGKYGKLIQKCTALDPADRYQTIDEVLDELLPEGAEAPSEINSEEKVPHAPKMRLTNNGTKGNETAASWLPPGFRTKTMWKMVLAGMVYLMLLWLGLSLEVTSEVPSNYPMIDLWLNRAAFVISQLMTVFFVFDYRGISEKIPFYKSKNIAVRIASFIVTWFVCMSVAVLFLIMIESTILS